MGEAHFSLRVPKYLNVGSLGLTLAHEMLHSLDSTGRGFDSRGVLANDFWDYETRKTFANVSQCINNQYREHFKRPIRVDSRTMMLEVSAKKSFKNSRNLHLHFSSDFGHSSMLIFANILSLWKVWPKYARFLATSLHSTYLIQIFFTLVKK